MHDNRRANRWNDRNDHRYDRDHTWKRGDRLGDYHRSYREIDYRSNRLQTPPHGYHYLRDNNTGEIILAAIAAGIIASIILN
ncbi:MAG: RcnB family protein [Hyphomonadaceae bacterium]|nr:RcnB family protein [Hyphomonadaceae bacterium]